MNNDELMEVIISLELACESLMGEVSGKKATNWAIVNDDLCEALDARQQYYEL